MARDTGGYVSGLTRFRLGEVVAWVQWMAEAVSRSAEHVLDVIAYTEEVRNRWEEALVGVRADAAARPLAELVQQHLVITAPMAADLLAVSAPATRGAIAALADRGILQPLDLPPTRPGRPAQWWMAGELVSLVSRWSR